MNTNTGGQESDTAYILSALRQMGLAGPDAPRLVPLTGGVSSDIYRVEDDARVFCVKGALLKLKVEADWKVPVRRNQAEAAWMIEAAHHVPQAVPNVIGLDPKRNVFAMDWFDPAAHPVWKASLLSVSVAPEVARAVGRVIGRIHAGTAGRAEIAAQFANAEDFDAIRLDPYLRATARAHPDLAARLTEIADQTDQTRLALVHGDVSPKNILVGPKGPILLDAECANYGDPAFDLAFCLNHMLLKAAHLPGQAEAFDACFTAMAESYFAEVTWEPQARIEARVTALLPALALARVDGKSPVEYLSDAQQTRVRAASLPLIETPAARLADIWTHWKETAL